MRKPTSFTIINRPLDETIPRSALEATLETAFRKESKVLSKSISNIPPALKAALLSTSRQLYEGRKTGRDKKTGRAAAASALPSSVVDVVKKLSEKTDVLTVGIVDLGAWVSRLPQLLEIMNKAQDRVVFLEVLTAVPAGLIKTKQPLIDWAQAHTKRALTDVEKGELTRNMLADEFFYFAESVRQQNGLGMLVGLTPAMIAFLDGEAPAWNYYTAGNNATSVVSTYELREFAMQAGRSYEAAIGMLIVGQVFADHDEVEYHTETRGCVFDFNEVRADLVKSLRAMRIEESCLRSFKYPEDASAAQALIRALARLKEPRSV